MANSIKLSIERQFSLAKVNLIIDDLTHEDLKSFAKEIYHHHLTYEQVTQEIIKSQISGDLNIPSKNNNE